MGKFRKSERIYHGDNRHAVENRRTLTATGAQTVTLSAKKHDTFEIVTCACAQTCLTVAIIDVVEGARIYIRVLSSQACVRCENSYSHPLNTHSQSGHFTHLSLHAIILRPVRTYPAALERNRLHIFRLARVRDSIWWDCSPKPFWSGGRFPPPSDQN